MRLSLVLAVLVVAGVIVMTLLSRGERASAERGAEATTVEPRPSGGSATLVAPNAAESSSGEAAATPARSELPDDAPRVRGVVQVDDGGALGEPVALQANVYLAGRDRPMKIDVRVETDGSFEFPVPAETKHAMLMLRAEGLHTPSVVRALPGEEVVVRALRKVPEPPADRGWVVSGIVRDQDGRPFADAVIYMGEPGSESWTSVGEERADVDGRFELTGLEPRAWRIGASSSEAVEMASVEIDATGGDVLGLEFTLQRGGCIAGTVHWPDGEVVEKFRLDVDGASGWSRRETFLEGEFRMCGLIEDEFAVRVRATRQEEIGVAELPGLRPGATLLRLVLAPQATFGVDVTARDEHGEPIDGLRIWANNDKGESVHASGDGTLRLTPLVPGEWKITLRANGFITANETIELAPGSPDLNFVLAPSARIRGTVLDAAGNPVAGADVAGGELWNSGKTKTIESGRFELEASPGKARVQARKSGHGSSEVAFVMTEAGRAEEVVLRLRDACTLQGRVFDENGDPAPDVWVMVGEPGNDDSSECDQSGAFEFKDLPPGPTKVNAFAMDGGSRASARVVLVASTTKSVELRFHPADPVRVSGRITRAGAPHAGSLGFMSDAGVAEAESDSTGRFEVTLPSPGNWNVLVQLDDNAPPAFGLIEIVIPDAEKHELTLEIDAMRRLESLDELPF